MEQQQATIEQKFASNAVVLAIDGSEHSERALQFYLDQLHRDGQVVHLVHALEAPHIPSQRDSHQEQTKIIEEKFEKILSEKQIEIVLHSALAKPGEYICRISQEQNAMMICMGTRGLGTIRRTIMGSVSDYVMHHAHCPVCIARK